VRRASTLAPSRCLIKIFPPAFVKLIFQFGKRKKEKSTCHHGIPAFFLSFLRAPLFSLFPFISPASLFPREWDARRKARAHTRPNLDLGLKSLLPANTHGPKIFNLRYVPKSLKILEITFSQKDKRKGNREREREKERERSRPREPIIGMSRMDFDGTEHDRKRHELLLLLLYVARLKRI